MIPEETIDEIRQRTDLVELVSDYLALEQRGKNMVGLCPFHSEKTPSFSVSPDKQLFHCFGCGASGNVFSLLMKMENLSFTEAARFLAARAGVRVPETSGYPSPADSLKENIYRLNNLAARFFIHCLHETGAGKIAMAYLLERGIKPETLELFKVGYAPAGWNAFSDFARKKGMDDNLMVKAGLVSPGKDKGCYDRFRDRIIFPIFNLSKRLAGFGGRALDEGGKTGPKYLNSPQTPVFDKGSMLYGLHLARDQIRKENKVLVMEGYTDVMMVHQSGIKNAVASLGTSLTANQARLLRSQADTAVIVYDSDSAGETATWRGLTILQDSGCLVQVANLPAGSDPDSLIREKGSGLFIELIDKARPLLEYRLDRLRERYDLATDVGRRDYLKDLFSFIRETANYVEQDYYLKKAAEELGVDETALRSELKRKRPAERTKWGKPDKDEAPDKNKIRIKPAEKILLALMLQSKEIAEQGRNLLKEDYIEEPLLRKIFFEVGKLAAAEKGLSAEKILSRLDDPQLVAIITEAVSDPALQDIEHPTAKRMAVDCLNQLHQVWKRRQQRELQHRLKELEARGAAEEVEQLLREHQRLLSEADYGPYRFDEGGDMNG